MAGKSATLTVQIVSDAKNATKGFSDAGEGVKAFEKSLDKASIASAGVLAGIGALAKGAFDEASRLQQSTGAIDSVFGDWALDIEQHAQKAADSVGLSTAAYEELASTLGATMKGMGQSNGEAMDSTTALIQTGADLAATFGGPTSEAVAALGSLMRGERDPIERFGISISQAAVDAKVAAMGMGDLEGAALKQAQATATMALVQEQAAGALGAFSRESDTAAGAQARAAAQFENAQAKLGEVLLPIVAQAMTKFQQFTAFLLAHEDTVKKVIVVVAGLAVGVLAINAAYKTYQAVATAVTAVQWLFNAALAANPIGLVVLAIAALAAGIYLAYQKFEPFRNVVDAVGRALRDAFQTGVEWAQKLWDKIQPVIDGIKKITGAVGGALGGLFGAPAPAPAGGAPLMGAMRSAPLAGGLYGATSGGTGGGAGRSSLNAAPAPVTVNVTVNGALDPSAVAEQIRGLLARADRLTGRTLAAAL